MAIASTRVELIEYALRRLGFPVIEINVDQDQVEDRVDDALQIYADYHFDAKTKVYHKHTVTQADLDNKYITVPEGLGFVTRIVESSSGGLHAPVMGDPNLNYAQNPLAPTWGVGGNNFSSTSSTSDHAGGGSSGSGMVDYFLSMQNLALVKDMFGKGSMPIRFNRHTNQVHIDTAWEASFKVDEVIVIEGYEVLDPDVYTDVYNDRWLKRYLTQLIKQQWGSNLIKYAGVQMVGGVTLDGDKLYDQATTEIETLEEKLADMYELPPMPFMG